MWKRRVMRLFLLLIAGAMVNVAVAWGCAISIEHDDPTVESFIESYNQPLNGIVEWSGEKSTSPGLCTIVTARRDEADYDQGTFKGSPSAIIPWWSDLMEVSERYHSGTEYRILTASGWPALALWNEYEQIETDDWNRHIRRGVETNIILTGSGCFPQSYPMILSVNPAWPGFAINTIFYAAVLWVVFAFPFVVRRRFRGKRGLCPACAYPIGTSPVCTECGAAVAGKRRSTPPNPSSSA